jgi:Pyrimidine dimer DNA glycosylase
MQTFLPYPDFQRTAECLDYRRLGKQRVEVLQLLNALDSPASRGWANHPATRMWRGYPNQLVSYGLVITREWIRRGYRDTCYDKIYHLYQHGLFYHEDLYPGNPLDLPELSSLPPWMGDPRLHRSHQSNLVRKDPDHYGPLFPGVPSDLEYVWPR